MSINNSYQEFHLSIEKKFTSLKKYYQRKVDTLFQVLQEEKNAITMFKMKHKFVFDFRALKNNYALIDI